MAAAASPVSPAPAPAPRALRIAVVAVVLLGSAVFLFARLGHYALWDDEVFTAVPALGLWRTGDTTLVLGKNVVAYRGGAMLTGDANLDRCSPPLMFFLAAPSLGVLGQNAWAARFPFALCGLGTVALLLHWAWRAGASGVTWILLGLAILGNVSFFLYSRQCRYYAPAILLSVAIACGYVFYDGRRRCLLALALLSAALVTTNPMNYVALYAAMAVDFILWGWRRRALTWRGWLWLFFPQLILAGPIIAIWNPSHTTVFTFPHENWIDDKLTLLYRNLRDLNRCEFGILPLIVLTPLFYFRKRQDWLLRAPLAFLIFIMVTTVVSPQPVAFSETADIRYVAPVIPLCMAIAVLALRLVPPAHPTVAVPLGLLVFGTNLLNLDPLFRGALRSTPAEYIAELYLPPSDPYTVTATWIHEHVKPGESICVLPGHMAFSLMFSAPEPIYAWQFDPANERRFRRFGPIHFWGKQAPDYFIGFGPHAKTVRKLFPGDGPIFYEPAATLDILWKDLYRPELFWRKFRSVTDFDKSEEAIYVFRKVESRPAPIAVR
jgi:hypothetical protein